ncbi:uncharacterized protein LOC115963393 isoform X2 [Quercus lobata]|uniref:uncharacterized protein LOC115963393 isoform X2 n=1 Tax=Quercus lobata TaxID=97700 RepID=UPI0012445430|nr:uncharacterized protein LOC115963393 isoform X2 [Quercus lobata]
MDLHKLPLVVLLFSVFSLLSFIALCDDSELTVKFSKTPHAFSNLNSTVFVFEVHVGGNGACTNCNITCKLDDGFGRINASQCENGTVLCEGLQDGNHKFEVCPNGTQGVGCSSYDWTVDTVPPTAYISTSTPFTNALNASINISFSEPCTGGGGFVCSSVNACNLLVDGAGQVIPNSLKTLQPNLQYSILVGLSSTAQSGRVILVMDKNFCTDSAGNKFERNKNSNFTLHFDRRSINFTTHVPERQLQLHGETRLIRATNNCTKLKICLTFPEPILNTSEEIKNSLKAEILCSLQMSQGSLLPLVDTKKYEGPSRFEFKVAACISDTAVVTVSVDSNSIISRHRTPVSPVEPVTFLYDSLRPNVTLITLPSESPRPSVMLSTPSHIWTREHNITMLIKFGKPVFGFNSSKISITGGHLQSFQEYSKGIYTVVIKADQDTVSVNVPENVTGDVTGNKNLPSNVLQVRHYSVPKITRVILGLVTTSIVVTFIPAGLITVSIASIDSIGEFSSPFSSLSRPESNLFRIVCHLQVFALSRWLAVRLPVEYYEFARGLQWSIPYFSLPWETGHIPYTVKTNSSLPDNTHSYMSKIPYSGIFPGEQMKPKSFNRAGLPLAARAYDLFIERLDAEYDFNPHILNGWRDFYRSTFWLAIIGGSFIQLHALLLVILKLRKRNSEMQRGYGVLTFPRFEIFLVNLGLPCICEASASLIRGGTALGIVVGGLLLGAVSFLLLALLLFLSRGITFEKLLQYKEVHQKGRGFHWYQEIVRVFLVSGRRGQWTWKNQQNSNYLTILGPLFEDFRGPQMSNLSQISEGSSHIQGAVHETEDEAPFIQKLFGKFRICYTLLESVIRKLCGKLRIYYTLLESVRRVLLGVMAGAYMENPSSKIPSIIFLCITFFQLFFLVLEPFIKKSIQWIEIMSILSEAGVSVIYFVLSEIELQAKYGRVGVLMLIVFLVGFLPQMMNELWALYKQIKLLDTAENRFLTGLKIVSFGLALLFISEEFLLSRWFPHLKDNIADSNSQPTSAAEKDTATPHLKDYIAGSNSQPTSVAEKDTVTPRLDDNIVDSNS